MFPSSPLSIFSYALGNPMTKRELTGAYNHLEFTKTAPGGYGDLKITTPVRDRTLVPADYGVFNRVAVMEDGDPVWLGRWDEPALRLDTSDGEVFDGSALGASHCLTDDPEDATYSGQTALQIITDQLQGATLGRSPWLPIDSDLTKVLPNNPAATFNYNPQGRTIDAVLNEILACSGDYTWGVWAHPSNKDAFLFPTWQLQAHTCDRSTIHYTATLADRIEDEFRPTTEYCFNAVKVKYKDGTSTLPASVTVQDSRLNNNKTQGTAPFPYRLLVKDLSSFQLSATQATAIANALLLSYKNGGFKITLKIASVKDAYGRQIPLYRVDPDHNIFIPELTPAATQVPLVPTQNQNLFYISETTYTEDKDSTPTLEIGAVSFIDRANLQISRLQYLMDTRSRSRRTHGVHQSVGEPEVGTVATSWPATAVTTDSFEEGVNFKTTMVNSPSSITLTATSSTNAATPSVVNITQTGFSFTDHPAANGAGFWRGSYRTNGN